MQTTNKQNEKFLALPDDSLFDDENCSTQASFRSNEETIKTDLADISLDEDKLNRVTTEVMTEIGNNQKVQHVYKELFGNGDISVEDQHKKIFECALDLYEKKLAAQKDEEKAEFRARVMNEDWETSLRVIAA